MTASSKDSALEEIRREIDAIDDSLLDLLGRRIQTSGRVRAVKSATGTLATSPIRPAREALILKRLMARRESQVPADLLVRLWRVILTSSSLAQAPIVVHISESLRSTDHRVLIADHFCATPVREHAEERQLLAHLATSPGEIGVVATGSVWIEDFLKGGAGSARVIGMLPVLGGRSVPPLLVIGQADAQPTGEDTTIILSRGAAEDLAALKPNWSATHGSHCVAGLDGFLTESDSPLATFIQSHPQLGLRVAGRCPNQIEVPS